MGIDILKSYLDKVNSFKDEIGNTFLSQEKIISTSKDQIDIVIITASIDEYHSITQFIKDSEIIEFNNDSILYLKGEILTDKKNIVKVICPIPSEMGIATASINTTKCIINFLPQNIFMVGICAGIKSSTKLGDIIIAEKCLDYNEVIEITNNDNSVRTKYMNNILSIPKKTKANIQLFCSKYLFDKKKMIDNFNSDIDNKCHFGLIATGSALLRNKQKVQQLNKDFHNLKGIDMETYGVFKAIDSFENLDKKISYVSIKSVSDFADNDKLKGNEEKIDRRNLALFNSSNFLINYIMSKY